MRLLLLSALLLSLVPAQGQSVQLLVQDSPLAGYGVKGIRDTRLSGGLAGVAGVTVVLVAATGLFWGLRRRPRTAD